MITIDSKVYEYMEGRPILDYLDKTKPLPLAARLNNLFCDLYTVPSNGEEILLLNNTDDRDGFFCYRQTLILIFIAAAREVLGNVPIQVRRSANKATYCEILDGSESIDLEDAALKIKSRMCSLIDAALPISKTNLLLSDAKELLKKEGDNYTASAVEHLATPTVNLYSVGGKHFHMTGVLAVNTSVISKFDLSAYRHGFLLQYPNYATHGNIPPFHGMWHFIEALEEYSIWEDVLSIHHVSDLNRLVREKRTREMVLIQEALHEKKIAQIADTIAKNFEEKKVVLITGPSASCKTTFANKLNIHLRANGLVPVTISLDDYYIDLEHALRDESGSFNFEELESIDYKLFNQHLAALIAGEEVEIPRFSFGVAKRMKEGRRLKLSNDQVIVVEGIHALNERLTPSVDDKNKFKIYASPLNHLSVDRLNPISPIDTRLVRRLIRDYNFRYSSAQNTFSMWPSVQRGEVKNIFPLEEKADVTFNSAVIYEFCVYRRYAQRILQNVKRSSEHYPVAKHLLDILSYFEIMDDDEIPSTSLIREFIGGSSFA